MSTENTSPATNVLVEIEAVEAYVPDPKIESLVGVANILTPFFIISNTKEDPEIAVLKVALAKSIVPEIGISTGAPTDTVAADEYPDTNQVGTIIFTPDKDAPDAPKEFVTLIFEYVAIEDNAVLKLEGVTTLVVSTANVEVFTMLDKAS